MSCPDDPDVAVFLKHVSVFSGDSNGPLSDRSHGSPSRCLMSTVEVFQPKRILSASNAFRLLSWVNDCLESGNQNLLIDCQDVAFMDSSGLGSLVAALKQVQQAKGTLALCTVNGQARMLLEMAGVEQKFAIYLNQEQFYQAMSGTE